MPWNHAGAGKVRGVASPRPCTRMLCSSPGTHAQTPFGDTTGQQAIEESGGVNSARRAPVRTSIRTACARPDSNSLIAMVVESIQVHPPGSPLVGNGVSAPPSNGIVVSRKYTASAMPVSLASKTLLPSGLIVTANRAVP